MSELKMSKWEKLGKRWVAGWNSGSQFSGLELNLTRQGIEFHGFYENFVGLPGGFIPWEVFDALRKQMP